MPDSLGPNGLQLKTRDELTQELTLQMQTIYGTDVNLAPDTPDGQMLGIYVQGSIDVRDLLRRIYNSFDPDSAFGRVLDQRVAINGVERQGGTRTLTNITVVTSQALNLYGVDQDVQQVFRVQDNEGTQFELIQTYNAPGAGSYSLAFRAVVPGEVLTMPNTLTIPVSIVLGVVSVNNPTTYTTLGINEESDARLKIRRQKSVSMASQGYLQGLKAVLENINGVTEAFIYENKTGVTDIYGVPGHCIWVIISGTADPADIADAIYRKRNAGANMFGSESYTITQVDGTPFIVNWDFVTPEDLYIEFDATSLDGVTPPNTAAILAQLPTVFVLGVNERININDLATAVQLIDNNTLVTNAGFSTSPGGPFVAVISPSNKNRQFAVSAGRINITVTP